MTQQQPFPTIQSLEQPATEPVLDSPRPERREIGAPKRETWTLYEAPAEGLSAGIWTCEPGRWRIEFGPRQHEYFMVLEGIVRLHQPDGTFKQAGPGEALLIPAGFKGSFEVLERVRKHFVLVSPAA